MVSSRASVNQIEEKRGFRAIFSAASGAGAASTANRPARGL
jgi:hypothetical protein